MSVPNLRAIRNWCRETFAKKDEVEKINEDLGGNRFGVDEEGNHGYYKTDETGADTFVPFKSGGGGVSEFELNFRIYSINGYKYNSTTSLAGVSAIQIPSGVKKIKLSGSYRGYSGPTGTSQKFLLQISNNVGTGSVETIFTKTVGTNQTISQVIEEYEINPSMYEGKYITCYCSTSSTSAYFDGNMKIEF